MPWILDDPRQYSMPPFLGLNLAHDARAHLLRVLTPSLHPIGLLDSASADLPPPPLDRERSLFAVVTPVIPYPAAWEEGCVAVGGTDAAAEFGPMSTSAPEATAHTFAALLTRRGNSFGFVRLALACMVILSHSWTLSGSG